MPTLVVLTAAVNGFVTEIQPTDPATRPDPGPGTFVAGICVVVVIAVLRAAIVLDDAATRSVVPLLRTIVVIVLTLILLGVLALTGVDSNAQATVTRAHPGTTSVR